MISIGKINEPFVTKKSSKQRKRDRKRERREEKIRKQSAEREKNLEQTNGLLLMFSRNTIKDKKPKSTCKFIGKKEGIIVAASDNKLVVKVSIDDNKKIFVNIGQENVENGYTPNNGDLINIDTNMITYANDNINYEIVRDTKISLIQSNEEYLRQKRTKIINYFIGDGENIVIAKKIREETTSKSGIEFYVFSLINRMKTLLDKKNVEVTVIKRFVKEIENDTYLIKLPLKKRSKRGLKALGITESEMKDIISDYRDNCRKNSNRIKNTSIKSINTKKKKRTTSGFADAFSDSDEEF